MLNTTPPIRSFHDDLAAIVGRAGPNEALVSLRDVDAERWTYAELGALVERAWALYRRHGLRDGSTVVALLANAPETLVLFFAALAGGLRYAPLACTATEAELDAWLGVVKPELALVSSLTAPALVDALRRRGVPLAAVPSDGRFDWLPNASGAPLGRRGKVLLGTSGTTGVPKAMSIDGDTLWSSGLAFMNFHALVGSGARFWNYLPVSYLGGLFNLGLIPLAAEGSVLVDESFSGKTFLNYWMNAQRAGVDTLWLVPTVLRGLLAMNRGNPGRAREMARGVKRAFLGTAPIELDAKRRFEDAFGVSPLENFALSETTFLTSETPAAADLALRSDGSVGAALPYVDIRFRPAVDDEGEIRSQELVVQTPYLFEGYLGADGSVARPQTDDGGFPTGDLGYLNAHGKIVITGRLKDVVKRGGYFIALWEVEHLVRAMPGVRECAALGVKHDFYGESYVVYVVPESGDGTALARDVTRALHQAMAKFRWPEAVIATDEIPKTSSGKVRKAALATKGGRP